MLANKAIDTFVLSMIDIASSIESSFSHKLLETNFSVHVSYATASDSTPGLYLQVVYAYPNVVYGKPSSTGISRCVWYDPDEYNLITKVGEYQHLVESTVWNILEDTSSRIGDSRNEFALFCH